MLPKSSLSREIHHYYLLYFSISLTIFLCLVLLLHSKSTGSNGLDSVCRLVGKVNGTHKQELLFSEVKRLVDLANSLEQNNKVGKIIWAPTTKLALEKEGSISEDCVISVRLNSDESAQFFELKRMEENYGSIFLSWLDSYSVLILWIVPLFALPMWLATKSGLKPLNELVEQLRRKGVDSLSPTNITTQYAEVQPLIDQIDTLINDLRRKIGRENAFLHEAAHELRTPIAVIAAQAHVLAKTVNPSAGNEALKALNTAIKRTNHLVEQLLVLAQLEARDRYTDSRVEFSEVCSNTMAMLASISIDKEIELILEIDEDVSLLADEFSIYVIIKNLVINALQYSNRGSTVWVKGSRDSTHFVVCVQDNGSGIAVDDQSRLFERFFRGSSARTSSQGSGLGLAIVKAAVDSVGGTIFVESSSSGTSFVVRLPIYFS